MDMQEFIKHFSAQFDETPDGINGDTVFRNIEGWSSLVAVSVIAMADEEYNVVLKGDDIRSSVTVKDIFDKIQNLKK